MNGNRQRVAWAVLLSSFFVCILTLIAVPVGANVVRQTSRRPLVVSTQTNQGTLAMVHSDGVTSALLTSDSATETDIPVELITNSADTGLVQLFTPDSTSLVGRIQLYGNTILELESAEIPRFKSSNEPQTVVMNLNSGRLRLTIPAEQMRPVDYRIVTQQGEVTIREAGQYFVDVSNTGTQVSVGTGLAQLVSNGEQLDIGSDHRGVIAIGEGPTGPFETARNIVRNGDFGDSMAEWVAGTWNVELTDQTGGDMRIEQVNDEQVLRIDRVGVGHADASLRQIVDQDVSAYEGLRLLLSLRFLNQSLPVCGSLGTECPLTVRIDYVDQNGQSQVWQQGIYASGTPSTAAPNFCSVCGYPLNQNEHWGANRVGEVVFYESPNLIDLWAQDGISPVTIKSVSLIAAGHTFTYDVIDIGLVAENDVSTTPVESGALLPESTVEPLRGLQ